MNVPVSLGDQVSNTDWGQLDPGFGNRPCGRHLPARFAAFALALVASVLAACRATSVDPVQALRGE